MADAAPVTKPTLRQRMRRYRPYMIAASLLFSLGLVLTFQHKPAWYQPVEPTEDVVERARRDAPNLVDDISDHLVRGEPIEVVLRDDQVNEWLAALPEAWPDIRETIPREMSQPAIRFTSDGLRLGCHMESSGWKVIIGITVQLALVDGGDSVEIKLGSVQAGSLPLPAMLLKPMINRSLAQRDAGPAGPGNSVSSNEESMIRSADDLFDGIRIENRFEWPNGRRMFRVDSLLWKENRVVLTLRPV